MTSFQLVECCSDLDCIPVKVDCAIPEPVEPFVERAPPLYLRAEELIESLREVLGLTAVINVLEVQDYHPRSESEDEFMGTRRDFESDSDSSVDYPSFDGGGGPLKQWSRIFHFPQTGGSTTHAANQAVGSSPGGHRREHHTGLRLGD